MEAVNGESEVDKGGPPAPSPLTGCYLLIVVGEPHSKEHKDIILRRIAKGLLSWDASGCYVDLEKELAIISEQAPEGEDARYGERLIQFASENLVTEVLIHPAISTLSQCMKNLLSSFTRHRHVIHAGYTFAGNGSWILQDGTFSLTDFSEAFQEIDVQRVLRAYDNTISLDIHCAPEGDWIRLPKETFTRNCKVRVNPDDVLTSGSPAIVNFLNYISPFLIPTDIEMLLESSEVVGNIRFSHPTLYVFPGGQGDAALFGINGFNMLVDGGFARKACFWDFVRHLDRLDAVLLTRLNNSNVNGISSVLRRKRHNTVYPQIGHFFCNIQERKAILSPDGDKDKDPLLVNLFEEGQDILNNLRQLNLQSQPCYRDTEPINLYHKVGHGTLDMYILTPSRDSKEVKEFLQKWNTSDQRLFANQRNGKDFTFPTHNLVSICALLVWQPANANDNITRILFPGSSPQHKIFEGLDKLKQLDCVKFPSCSAKTLSPNILKSKLTKTEKMEKELKPKSQLDGKTKAENKVMDENIKNGQTNGITNNQTLSEKLIKKHDSTESEKSGPQSIDLKKPELTNGKTIEEKATEKAKIKLKPEQKIKPEIKVSKHVKSLERKTKPIDKKASPTTPKKTVEAKMNGDATKLKQPAKTSPSATPAKSAKDANNRKVVESKYKMAPKRDAAKPAEKKEPKPERKPISRRPKGTSPIGKVPESPIKKISELHKIETRKPKFEKECTTDSSTVSTPSADAETALKTDLSKLTPEELEQIKAREMAELKEEQEVVKEIEAVFRKSEAKTSDNPEMRKIKSISIDDKTEPETEEYLIIEKVEVDHDLVDEKDPKESETQKHLRDSEESEKQRKLSDVMESDVKGSAANILKQEKLQEEEVPTTYVNEEKDVAKTASKEVSVTTPDDKIEESSGKKMTDRDIEEENKDMNVLESQPDEKFSTPIESGATTAPTLPEDERIPLDEIKEDNGDVGIEEKYVKEDTKEKEIPAVQLPPKSAEGTAKIPIVVGIRLDKKTPVRDIVKTPDEVADLPMHEEVDIDYEHYQATEAETPKQDETNLLTIKPKVNGVEEDVAEPDHTIIPDNEVGEQALDDTKPHKDLDVTLNVESKIDVLKKENAGSEKLDDHIKEDTLLVDSILQVKIENVDEKLAESAKAPEIEEIQEKPISEADAIAKSTQAISDEEIKDSKIFDDKEKCDMEKNILAKESELVAVITDPLLKIEKNTEDELIDKQVDEVQMVDICKVSEELREEDFGSKKLPTDLRAEESPIETKPDEIVKDTTGQKLKEGDTGTQLLEDEGSVIRTEKEASSPTHDHGVTHKVTMSMEKTEITVEKTSKHKDDQKIGKEAVEEDEKDQDTTEEVKLQKPDIEEVVEEVELSTKVQLVEAQQLIKDVKNDIETTKSEFLADIDDYEIGKSVSKAFTTAGHMIDSVSKTIEERIHESELITTEETTIDKVEMEVEVISDIEKQAETVQIDKEAKDRLKKDVDESSYEKVVGVDKEDKQKELQEKDKTVSEAGAETKQQHHPLVGEVEAKTTDIGTKLDEVEKTIEIKLEESLEKESVTIEQPVPITVLEEVKSEDEEDVPLDDKTVIRSVGADSLAISKIDKKLQELKDITDAEAKLAKNELELVDKMELGRKSPKEREQDVALIVASVAEVLKSDAPLEEFEGKIPLEVGTFNAFTPFTTELRETHITTVESPISDVIVESIMMAPIEEEKFVHSDPTSLFINEERKVAAVHSDYDALPFIKDTTRVSSLLKDSNELMQATSKMISEIKHTTKVPEHAGSETSEGEKLHDKSNGDVDVAERKSSLNLEEISKTPISSDKTSPDIKTAVEDVTKLTKDIIMSASEVIIDRTSYEAEITGGEGHIPDKTLEQEIVAVEELIPTESSSKPSDLLSKTFETDRDVEHDPQVNGKESLEHTSKHDTKSELGDIDIKATHDLQQDKVSEPLKLETKYDILDEQEQTKAPLRKLSVDLKADIVPVTSGELDKASTYIEKEHIPAAEKPRSDDAMDKTITDSTSALVVKESETIPTDDASEILTQSTTAVESSVASEKDTPIVTITEKITPTAEVQKDDGSGAASVTHLDHITETESIDAKNLSESEDKALNIESAIEKSPVASGRTSPESIDKTSLVLDRSLTSVESQITFKEVTPVLTEPAQESARKSSVSADECQITDKNFKKSDQTSSDVTVEVQDTSPIVSRKTSSDVTSDLKSTAKDLTHSSPETKAAEKSPSLSGKTSPDLTDKHTSHTDQNAILSEPSVLGANQSEITDKSPSISGKTSPVVIANTDVVKDKTTELAKLDAKDSERTSPDSIEEQAPLLIKEEVAIAEANDSISLKKSVHEDKETPAHDISTSSIEPTPAHKEAEVEHKHDSPIEAALVDVTDKAQESESKDRSPTSSGRTSPSSIMEKVVDEGKEAATDDSSLEKADLSATTDTKLILEQSRPEIVPDTKEKEITASVLHSGRITPESIDKDHKASVLEHPKDVKENNVREKSTDVKPTEIDAESSIELLPSSESVKHEVLAVDINVTELSPSLIHDSEDALQKTVSLTFKEDISPTPSGKSTPEVEETVTKGKSQVSSGKVSSDIGVDKSQLDSGMTSQYVILESKETEVKSSTPVPSEKFISVIDKPETTQPHETSTSGRSSPEISELTKDLLDTKQSPILSRKSTPEIIVDSEFVVSDRLTPEEEIETDGESGVTDVKHVAADGKEEHISESTTELTKADVQLSGIQTEDISIVADPSSATVTKSHDVKEPPTEIHSEPGPSGRLVTEIKGPQEVLDSSRKSTPDIAIRNDKDTEELLSGRTTPPTAPVSPILKEKCAPSHIKQSAEKKDTDILICKTADLRSSTPASDDCDISSGQVSRVLTTDYDDEKQIYSDDEEIPGSPLSATSQIAHSTSSQYDIEDSVRAVAAMDPMSTSLYGALPDEPIDTVKETKTAHIDDRASLKSLTSSQSHIYEITTAKFSSINLPSDPVRTALQEPDLMTASFIGSELPTDATDDPIASWGKPLGLPSPAPLNDNKGTPKKEKKIPSNVVVKNKLNEDKKNSDSKYDRKGKKINPVYVDLTYVPHNGNSNYSYVDFFKRVRARYYVFSGIEPSKEVYSALLEAKLTWDDKDLEVTIIPTYDTDVLGYWVAENEDLLAKYKIDLSPSASRCTINLQDHETSCSAYRLEFS